MADPTSSSNNDIPSTSGQQVGQQNDTEAQDEQKKTSRKRKLNSKVEACCTKQRCGLKLVSLQTRKHLKQEYSEQNNTGHGFSYLRRYVVPETITNPRGKRRITYRYYIPNGEEQIEICQMAFRMVYGITDRMLRDARDKKGKCTVSLSFTQIINSRISRLQLTKTNKQTSKQNKNL